MGFPTQGTLSIFSLSGTWVPFVGQEKEIKETTKGEADCSSRVREGKVSLRKEKMGLSQSWSEGQHGIKQIGEI